MSSRRILSISLAVLVIVGIYFASVPFVSSFRLPGRSSDDLPRVELASLGPGKFVWAKSLEQTQGIPDLLVIQDFDSQIRVFRLPVMDGKYLMPDATWDRWGGACADFGPDGARGSLAPGGTIRCRDSAPADSVAQNWQWSYSGEKLGPWSADLRQVEFVRDGASLRLGR